MKVYEELDIERFRFGGVIVFVLRESAEVELTALRWAVRFIVWTT